MRAGLLAAVLAMSCRIDLDHREIPRTCEVRDDIDVCKEAADHSDFEWLQANLFTSNCSGRSCHGMPGPGKTQPGGKIELTPGMTYKVLLGDGTGAKSAVDPTRVLVRPGYPNDSYLYFLLRGVRADDGEPPFEEPPEDVGYMPMDNDTLCCQKIEAVGRWIEAGALP